MPDMEAEIELLEAAMAGVKLVICDLCDDSGKVGLSSMQAPCPRCGGSKVTTTSEGTE